MTITVDRKNIIQKLILSQPVNIPVFHEVALRLLQMMNGNSYRIEEAIKLVNEDTALASEMLRHANTTYNSGTTPITTIKNAIVRLGSQQVVNLAFTASMATNISDNPIINAQLKRLWKHSHAVAITSAWLAVQTSHNNPALDINADEVYLAGLFHDIGKLYLLKSMDNLIKLGILKDDDELIAEMLEGFSLQLGIKVMQHLHIPEIYSDSVERHITDNWQCGTNDHLVAAVRLSCKIHECVQQGVELTKTSDINNQVNEELSLLGIGDISYVYDLVEAMCD